jgi:hypothetical protein
MNIGQVQNPCCCVKPTIRGCRKSHVDWQDEIRRAHVRRKHPHMLCLISIAGGLLIMMGQHDRFEALFYYGATARSGTAGAATTLLRRHYTEYRNFGAQQLSAHAACLGLHHGNALLARQGDDAILQASPFMAELGPAAPAAIFAAVWRAQLGF